MDILGQSYHYALLMQASAENCSHAYDGHG